MRYIPRTNLQILQFSPIMRHQSCFTTSFPGASPFINTGLCKGVCALWQGQHLYQTLLNIHSFSLNKQINRHYRHNTFLFPSICSVLPLPTSWARVWVAQGRERGAVPCSQPVPCSTAAPLTSGHPDEDREGLATHNPRPFLPVPPPC